jgi:hypothetical protein
MTEYKFIIDCMLFAIYFFLIFIFGLVYYFLYLSKDNSL